MDVFLKVSYMSHQFQRSKSSKVKRILDVVVLLKIPYLNFSAKVPWASG